MEVLMLRLDLFEKQHDNLFRFWKEIIHAFDDSFDDSNLAHFTLTFTNWSESFSPRIFPEMYILSESYFNMQATLNDLEDAQKKVKENLGMPKILDIMKARIELARGMNDMTPEKKRLLEEYFEIGDSKKILDRDMENLSKVILKERQKLWNCIDNIIITSYKQMLYDITSSDEFAESFMKELLIYGIMKDFSNAKRNHDCESIIDTTGVIDECIGDWVCDIEQLVGEQPNELV